MLETFKNYLKKTLLKEDFEELEKLKKSYKKAPITKKQETHINKLAKKKINNSKQKIENLLGGLYAEEYKKNDGSYNIYKIAKDLKMSRNTIIKYLKKGQKK